MPEGIVIIKWDEFEGGMVEMKYPEKMKIPENFIQILQISQTFNPGIMTIKEKEFHALYLGNELVQKVIVLILTKYEDSEDFVNIVETINEIIEEISSEELKRVYELSQSVFRAREAVLQKLADELADLKNRETDLKQILKWLIREETTLEKKIIYQIMSEGSISIEDLQKKLDISLADLEDELDNLQSKNIIELKNDLLFLVIQYL